MNLNFAKNTALIKRIARSQMMIDDEFASASFSLRRKLFVKEITPIQFWEQYKKALMQSLDKNKKTASIALKKADAEMKERLKKAEQEEKEKEQGEPILDLSVPQ